MPRLFNIDCAFRKINQMKNLNFQTGKNGEEIARKHLAKKGYRIVQSNFRSRFGEIDIIATKDKKLAFVEVKLKIGEQFGSPEEMINKGKIAKIKIMAEIFLQSNPEIINNYSSLQIDAICIVLNNDQSVKRITHWENISNEMV